jgi:hypothetical protein
MANSLAPSTIPEKGRYAFSIKIFKQKPSANVGKPLSGF